MIINTTYDDGGYDPNKPNNNIVETVERIDREHCVIKQYDGETIINEETVYMLEPIENENAQLTIPKSAVTKLAEDMANPSINSISEIKSVISDFASKIQ